MAKIQEALLKSVAEDQKGVYQSTSERFAYVGKMFVRNSRPKQYAELNELHETLRDIENQAMQPWSKRVVAKRGELETILSEKHCRGADRRRQQTNADSAGLDIVKLTGKFEAIAALQQERTRILGWNANDYETPAEYQTKELLGEAPAAGPLPE